MMLSEGQQIMPNACCNSCTCRHCLDVRFLLELVGALLSQVFSSVEQYDAAVNCKLPSLCVEHMLCLGKY